MIRIDNLGLVYYQFKGLAAEPGLRHGFFTRLGGVSQPPFASLNMGASVGDDAAAVAENRRRACAALGFADGQVVTPYQVHSTVLARVGQAQGGQVIEATDGLLTAERGVALFLRFADCVPVMLHDREHHAIALVHAGWRGTLDGIASLAVAAMQAHFGSQPAQLWAGIGPAIGPCCYQVSAGLAAEFAKRFGAGVVSRPASGSSHLDLPTANTIALGEAGVRHIEQADLCTACHVDEFFSHRKEAGRTGRLGALVGLVA
ncbi:MAG TPA: peptidoglycan editing factor PgeF [Anaerolineae bacterium]|nr:peptidoglycan editing factor PgeF [Anaerolineae bacterium]HOR00967.1 peptidoglycan editing factor PgeF [Anaerolineae bacterium]HPL29748.1 peptidoglycan editing factor PgeF [Anaerolineae bacterium]